MGNLEKSFEELGKILDGFFTTIRDIFSKKKLREYITIGGNTVVLDISDEALGRYKTVEREPLKHDMRVRVNFLHRNATIKGVGKPTDYPEKGDDADADVVWVLLDGAQGVTYGYPTDKGDFSSLPD
jgi:hypothetical protein